ncbi:MAG: ATP-dependent DNA helicase RecG, partial [Syntrophobacterales bacterium]|jgi:ATP-dependent DNA helicase RecG|nr:ATP-dependent DNA helicase RecG [Syntrophobacterales bacterium]
VVAKWFHGQTAYLHRAFKEGKRYILTGEIKLYGFQRNMLHPDFELLGDEQEDMVHFRRIVPLYSEIEGVPAKVVRRIMLRVVEEYADAVISPIPESICRQRRLMNIHQALRHVHFPPEGEDIALFNERRSDAYRRLIYDEFFFFQLAMAMKKQGTALHPGIVMQPGGVLAQRFQENLPFPLTKAQGRVIGEIEDDMRRASPMTRLLQGDVGSGKTVVAMAAMVVACDNGYQAAMMVPTELLAEQHFRTLSSWAGKLGLETALLSGSLGVGERRAITDAIREGKIHLVVGTHALISAGTEFANLGLVVIDEQHRFGVLQKASIRSKGLNPHVLVMTATPIPRTLAMTVYGDLDVSVIDELPPGKKAIQTKVMYEHHRERVYEMIRKELQKNHQVFIVYPLVEESENLDLKDATRMAEHLSQNVFPGEMVGLVHGKMKNSEREEVMSSFVAGDIRILVATTVIEVGIDVPQASLMIIEHAERFGLSQLHQLRGRVGRSDIPSFCVLLAQKNMSPEAKRRLKVMVESQDGFRLAEEDLAIRGPGEFMGTRQSGLPDFRIAHIVRDMAILEEAKRDAFHLLEDDPGLCKGENSLLLAVMKERWQEKLDIAQTA